VTLRLNKFLSRRGLGARRKCDTLIEQGKVRVNGQIVRELGTQVEPERDRVEVEGRLVPAAPAPRYYALNKPVGVITTLDDPEGRRTVRELLPPGSRLFPVGRLDADTSGLLLLTNDGDLAHHLMHPRYGVEKVYRVWLERPADGGQLARLRAGVEFEPGVVSEPARVRPLSADGDRGLIEIAIHEGRHRQVRLMCEAVGLHVTGLHRSAYGPVRLGPLERGMWRELSDREVALLREASARPRPRIRRGEYFSARRGRVATAPRVEARGTHGRAGSVPERRGVVAGDRSARPRGAGSERSRPAPRDRGTRPVHGDRQRAERFAPRDRAARPSRASRPEPAGFAPRDGEARPPRERAALPSRAGRPERAGFAPGDGEVRPPRERAARPSRAGRPARAGFAPRDREARLPRDRAAHPSRAGRPARAGLAPRDREARPPRDRGARPPRGDRPESARLGPRDRARPPREDRDRIERFSPSEHGSRPPRPAFGDSRPRPSRERFAPSGRSPRPSRERSAPSDRGSRPQRPTFGGPRERSSRERAPSGRGSRPSRAAFGGPRDRSRPAFGGPRERPSRERDARPSSRRGERPARAKRGSEGDARVQRGRSGGDSGGPARGRSGPAPRGSRGFDRPFRSTAGRSGVGQKARPLARRRNTTPTGRPTGRKAGRR
jgi:pseudouridine synthase